MADLRKPRNPAFNRLAHGIGGLVAENIEAFAGMDPHDVLKRVQIEGRIACDEVWIQIKGGGGCYYLVPQSLSFEAMDEARFQSVIGRICRHIHDSYWGSCDPEEIVRMAECWMEGTP